MSEQDEDQRLLDEFIKPISEKYAKWNGEITVNHNPPGSERESWQRCYELARKYDEGLCGAYRDEIDTLLVFAGLFSAVVTAFTVESYQWLHDDSGDVSVQLLAQIATILNHSTPIRAPATSALSGSVATRINVFWFASLILSLSAALVGILCKQWIREYSRDAGGNHQESLGVRQMKLEGLEAWKVSTIVASVPLLLQAALSLFFLGVIDLLWKLSPIVATPIVIVVVLSLSFYMATTTLPAVHVVHRDPVWGTTALCPYKSPQAWLALRAVSLIWSKKNSPTPAFHCDLAEETNMHRRRYEKISRSLRQARSWTSLDVAWTRVLDAGGVVTRPMFCFKALAWLREAVDPPDMHYLIWHCLTATTRPRFGFERPAILNILCCMPARDSFTNIPQIPSIRGALKQTECMFHLLEYAIRAGMPEKTCLDLICQIFHSARKRSHPVGLTQGDCHVFSSWFSLIRAIGVELPEPLLDDLFYALYFMTEPQFDDPTALDAMLSCTSPAFLWARPSRHKTRLRLALCARLRWWLGHANDANLLDRGFTCALTIGPTIEDYERAARDIEGGPPYSVETVIFAYLARDMLAAADRYFVATNRTPAFLQLPGYRDGRLAKLAAVVPSLSRGFVRRDASVSGTAPTPGPSSGQPPSQAVLAQHREPVWDAVLDLPSPAPEHMDMLLTRGDSEGRARGGAQPREAPTHDGEGAPVHLGTALTDPDSGMGVSLEHWDGMAAQEGDSGTAPSAPGRSILEMLAAGEAARAASSPGHPALQTLYPPTGTTSPSGPPGRLGEEGAPAGASPTQAGRGPDRERTPIATAEPVGPPVIGWLQGTETREASRARTGEGTPPVPGGERTRRWSVDLELGMPRDSASGPGMPAPCPDECECSICVRQRL